MITLITGTPGAGKTAFALDMMVRQGRLDNSRKLYVHGIPELKVPHEIVICSSATCDYCSTLPTSRKALVHVPKKPNLWANSTGLVNSLDLTIKSDADLVERDIEISYKKAEDWHIFAEHGAILFFDEVQNIHRPRNSGSPVPDSIAAYEVHRHRGLDFFIITQNPSLIDSNLRALVSRHIHLSSTWARRKQFEYPQCKTDLSATTGEGIESTYTLPKDVFKLYKSASLHTKLERKVPFALYGIGIVLVLIAVLVFYEYNNFMSKSKPLTQQSPVSAPVQNQIPPVRTGGETVREAQAARAGASPAAYSSKKQILDMPKLFKKWSQLGISDDELKFLPIGMCGVSSSTFVKCKFGVNLSFKYFFSNISCTPTNCFAFLARIPPVEIRQREPMPTPSLPSLPFSADSVTQVSSQ